MTAIHNARLIHRDLKPENLMLRDEANTDELLVKVIDFGIVRVLDNSTVIGQIAGSLHYLAPEQLTGQDVTPASDVYSLGVIAHEMLTGRRPFNPENPAHLLKLQQEGVKVKPTALRPGLPEAAERLILKALRAQERQCKSANHRPSFVLKTKVTPSRERPPGVARSRVENRSKD